MITIKFIKDARKKTGLSQKAFGEKLGVTRESINNYERGLCRVPGDIVLKVQELLKKIKKNVKS